ncbi:hypothetical protein D187_006381 [Cystobacter fuscus DSM 2262]|uniref:Uncharacterized protein n=1 Tax=Cystobacter fuscus (strain ATCC 25194 / DSM 2262 / NBRC 100088 / M29) TaxID=1242864 RepID=S9PIR3_CYSF2|nr:hypothetical protein D187_006381 [Cystobacter fuscus DSM 2262]
MGLLLRSVARHGEAASIRIAPDTAPGSRPYIPAPPRGVHLHPRRPSARRRARSPPRPGSRPDVRWTTELSRSLLVGKALSFRTDTLLEVPGGVLL